MTFDWLYLAQTLGWCGVGFVTGFMFGHTARDVHRIAAAVTPAEEDPLTEPAVRRRRWLRRIEPHPTIVAVVVFVMAILSVVQGIAQSRATEVLVRCQQTYSNAFADALDARSDATGDAQDALDALIARINELLQSGDPRRREELQGAINDYVGKRAEVKALQRDHPYPPPPRAACR